MYINISSKYYHIYITDSEKEKRKTIPISVNSASENTNYPPPNVSTAATIPNP